MDRKIKKVLLKIVNEISDLKNQNSSDILKAWPVGSIFMSTSASTEEEVQELLGGGQWSRIQDTFLLASGTNFPVDLTNALTATKGSAALQKHTHSYSSNRTSQPYVKDTSTHKWYTYVSKSINGSGGWNNTTWDNSDAYTITSGGPSSNSTNWAGAATLSGGGTVWLDHMTNGYNTVLANSNIGAATVQKWSSGTKYYGLSSNVDLKNQHSTVNTSHSHSLGSHAHDLQNHTHTTNIQHFHNIDHDHTLPSINDAGTGTEGNMPPYLPIYMWKRVG